MTLKVEKPAERIHPMVALQRLSIVLTATTGLLALGIVLMLYSPPIARRDFEIRILQDKLMARTDEVAQLRAYAQEVQRQQERVKVWEQAQRAEEDFRAGGPAFREQVLSDLSDIKNDLARLAEDCHGTRPDR